VEPVDRLRAGVQLVFRNVGTLSENALRVDWALIDYRILPWLGIRAGIIKMPLGLYNEFVDIDSARTAILMPQSVYPMRNRDALISHTGFAAYGTLGLGGAGELDYQAWLGTLTIPSSALELDGASLTSVDTKYVAGAQLFWRTPLTGLRLGGSYMRTAMDFHLMLDRDVLSQAIAMDLVDDGYDGSLLVTHDPASFWVASAELTRGDWLFAAEYSRWLKHERAEPALIPTMRSDEERLYALATYRFSAWFELGTYIALTHKDVADRDKPDNFQRDVAASARFDINDYWLWKLEAHYIDGVAELQTSVNKDPTRRWGLFLFRTTVTF
jgi:hypothetical protein